MLALPVGRETHEPGDRQECPLRLGRLDREKVGEELCPDQILLEDRERAVARSARHEVARCSRSRRSSFARRAGCGPDPAWARFRCWPGSRRATFARPAEGGRGFEDRPAVPGRVAGEPQDLRRVQPPGPGGQQSSEGHRVVRIGADAKRRLEVSDLRQREEPRPADDRVWDVGPPQALGYRLAVAVTPVQDREVAPAFGPLGAVRVREARRQGFEGRAKTLDDDVGLVGLVAGIRRARPGRPPSLVGRSGLAGLEPDLVVFDQGVRRREDVRARSAVLQKREASQPRRDRARAPTQAARPKRSLNWEKAA